MLPISPSNFSPPSRLRSSAARYLPLAIANTWARSNVMHIAVCASSPTARINSRSSTKRPCYVPPDCRRKESEEALPRASHGYTNSSPGGGRCDDGPSPYMETVEQWPRSKLTWGLANKQSSPTMQARESGRRSISRTPRNFCGAGREHVPSTKSAITCGNSDFARNTTRSA